LPKVGVCEVNDFLSIFSRFTWQSALDVILVAAIFYGMLRLFRGTQAVQFLRGILVILLVIVLLTTQLKLPAFTWLVRNSLPAVLIAIPVIFQPELRRALERLGRASPFLIPREQQTHLINEAIGELCEAVVNLSRRRHGAIIVLEGETGLQDYVETGVLVDARLTARLLLSIFYPGTALHDGAVIVRGNRVVAAACLLPLTERSLDAGLGTRHRAAVGITEQSDALAIVVSEETGIISVARSGGIARRLDKQRLRRVLESFYFRRARRII